LAIEETELAICIEAEGLPSGSLVLVFSADDLVVALGETEANDKAVKKNLLSSYKVLTKVLDLRGPIYDPL
jgi:hypothetical protein